MSYILEALRKADADRERERGGIPTIHSPGAPAARTAGHVAEALSADDDDLDGARRPASRPLVGAVFGLGLTVMGLLGWMLLGGPTDRSAPIHVAPPQAAPHPPPTAPMAEPPISSTPIQPRWDAAVPRATPQTWPPAAQRNAPPPAQPMAQPTTPPISQTTMQPAAPSTPAAVAAQKEPRSDAAPATARVPTLDELPDDMRRQLPVLAVNGSKYADAPASRILILNGQIFHEGDRIAPDLTLEHIRLKEAELRYRGQRYLIKY